MLASLLTYLLTSHQLHSQVDTQLRERGQSSTRLLQFLDERSAGTRQDDTETRFGLALGPSSRTAPHAGAPSHAARTGGTAASTSNPFGSLPPGPDQVRGYQQVVGAQGSILVRSARGISLPVDTRTRLLAAHGGASFFRDAYVDGADLRILAEPLGSGRAVQYAQPLTEVDSLLRRLRLILALLDIGGIALAALLGRLVAGAAVLPLKRLTQATEHVALTQDLSGRIDLAGEDEIGRLASSFNAMLDALEHSMGALDASVHAQRQLVADASHELRTPVTSLRTNIEILQQAHDMEPDERQRLLADVVEQIGELTLLMNDLIELARGEEPSMDTEDLRLDVLVSDITARTRRHSPATLLRLELTPTIVAGVPARLERAVVNLLDNAIKYSPSGEPVEIVLADPGSSGSSIGGIELTVRDHGPGISAEDLAHVFDRFYRGAEARGRPGSGLGLAIVRQVVRQHGGTVVAERAAGGGTLMRVRLPGAETVSVPVPVPVPPEPSSASGASVGETLSSF